MMLFLGSKYCTHRQSWKLKLALLLPLMLLTVFVKSQDVKKLRIGFYNVENFFDPFVDSTREYNEFTEQGEQRWNYFRYKKKRTNMYKTIMAMGAGKPLSLMGLCEIENDFVLRDLIYNTPLKQFNYQYINYPSPDRRGIDVGIIYRPEQLRLIYSEPIPLKDPENPRFRSRDMLYASFLVEDTDTIHVYVNHWPSRWGGEVATKPLRMLAAKRLRRHLDSIRENVNPHANFIIMGDFNDTPDEVSVTQGLRALPVEEVSEEGDLVNLFTPQRDLGYIGTLKYQYNWQIFDMLIVSQSLYNAKKGVHYKPGSAQIFNAPFLFVEDERYMGDKLFRTYIGPKYQGGFSDHLPIYIDLLVGEE